MNLDRTERDAFARRHAAVLLRCVENTPVTKRETQGSGTTYFIKTPAKEVLQFGEEEYFLWRSLDGRSSFEDIQARFRERFSGHVSLEHFLAFTKQLSDCKIVEPPPPELGYATPVVEGASRDEERPSAELAEPITNFKTVERDDEFAVHFDVPFAVFH